MFNRKGRGVFFCLFVILSFTTPSFASKFVSCQVKKITFTITSKVTLSQRFGNMTAEEKAMMKVLKVDSFVTDLAGLEEFTSLDVLDLSEATGLVSVDIRGLKALKTLELSGNHAIKTLNISSTPVNNLNAQDCIALEVLDCSNCGLSKLNLSGCLSLKVLDCSSNSLLRLYVRELASLEVLNCSNQIITDFNLALKVWDFSGDEVKPAKISYDFVTGFEDVKMDVTIFPDFLEQEQ